MTFFYLEAGKALVDVGKTLLGLKESFAKENLEQRIRIADYMDKISFCLTSIAQKAGDQGNHATYSDCSRLSQYLKSLPDVIEDHVDEATLEKLIELLRLCSNARALLSLPENAKDPSSGQEALETTAGYFNALADRLRV